MELKKYKLKLTYFYSGKTEELEIMTADLDWSMNEYQRNRPSFKWEILKDGNKDN
jgi:hypothetical protein